MSCYLNRYDDLQKDFGEMGYLKAGEHWYTKGFAEGRNSTCPDISEGTKCADEGEECTCPAGTVFLMRRSNGALRSNHDPLPNEKKEDPFGFEYTPVPPSAFSEAMQWSYAELTTKGGRVSCQADGFDPAPRAAKACFCEQKMPDLLKRAGAENSSVSCNGAVFFGVPDPSIKGTKAAFASLTEKKYLVKNFTQGGSTELTCNAQAFGKPDFLPEEKKECFCDSSVFYSAARVQIDMDRFKSQDILATLES
jgi:hypothetical protein